MIKKILNWIVFIIRKVQEIVTRIFVFIDRLPIFKVMLQGKIIPCILVAIIYIYVVLLIFLMLIKKFLSIFGINWNFNAASLIPGKIFIYWLFSIMKFIFNVALFLIIIFNSSNIFKFYSKEAGKGKDADIIYTTIKTLIQYAYLPIILTCIIIGNGLLSGLYRVVCSGKNPNLATFSYIPDNIIYLIILVSVVILILLKKVGITSVYINKPFIILGIIYIVYGSIMAILENIISQNLYFILKGVNPANNSSGEDCYDDGDEEDKFKELKEVLNLLFSILLWPLMALVIIVGIKFGSIEQKVIIKVQEILTKAVNVVFAPIDLGSQKDNSATLQSRGTLKGKGPSKNSRHRRAQVQPTPMPRNLKRQAASNDLIKDEQLEISKKKADELLGQDAYNEKVEEGREEALERAKRRTHEARRKVFPNEYVPA